MSKSVGVMYRLNQFLPSQTLISIYYALVYPYLGYGVESWYSVTKTMSEKVRILQKKSIRSIFKIPYNGSTRTYFKEFNILQLPEVYKFKICSMFAKYIKDDASSNDYISNYLQLNSDIHRYNTRIRDNFSVPYFRRSASQSCFIYQSINNWNSLPDVVKQKKNQANFNRILRKYLVSHY